MSTTKTEYSSESQGKSPENNSKSDEKDSTMFTMDSGLASSASPRDSSPKQPKKALSRDKILFSTDFNLECDEEEFLYQMTKDYARSKKEFSPSMSEYLFLSGNNGSRQKKYPSSSSGAIFGFEAPSEIILSDSESDEGDRPLSKLSISLGRSDIK